tara:strand:+ start:3977 stop:4183 length:207 start_codon:yes stop_codon:yes gene_type:complete
MRYEAHRSSSMEADPKSELLEEVSPLIEEIVTTISLVVVSAETTNTGGVTRKVEVESGFVDQLPKIVI